MEEVEIDRRLEQTVHKELVPLPHMREERKAIPRLGLYGEATME